MFGRKLINGSIKWLGVPNFLWNYGPSWTLNFLDPYASWGTEGLVPVKTLVVVMGGIPTLFLSNGIGPLAPFQFTIG